MTMIDEVGLLEQYNLELNEKMEKISKSIKYKYYCDNCSGSGKRYISPICDYKGIDRKCYICNGHGYNEKFMNTIEKNIYCIQCKGIGKIRTAHQDVYPNEYNTFYSNDKCESCNGLGIIRGKQFI